MRLTHKVFDLKIDYLQRYSFQLLPKVSWLIKYKSLDDLLLALKTIFLSNILFSERILHKSIFTHCSILLLRTKSFSHTNRLTLFCRWTLVTHTISSYWTKNEWFSSGVFFIFRNIIEISSLLSRVRECKVV